MTLVPTFFSRTANLVIGALLVVLLIWAVYMLEPTAIERWFR